MSPTLQSLLLLLEKARDKETLIYALLGFVGFVGESFIGDKSLALDKLDNNQSNAINNPNDTCLNTSFSQNLTPNDIDLLSRAFFILKERILDIFNAGDMIDCRFLYIGFLLGFMNKYINKCDYAHKKHKKNLLKEFRARLQNDLRFRVFIELSNNALSNHPSDNEHVMLIWLGAVARMFAYPNMCVYSRIQASKLNTLDSRATTKYTVLRDSIDSNSLNNLNYIDSFDNLDYFNSPNNPNGLAFLFSNIMLCDMTSQASQQTMRFIYEALRIFNVDFSLFYLCVKQSFRLINKRDEINRPYLRRNVLNWQLQVFWNTPCFFNNRGWLMLYESYKDLLYSILEKGSSQSIDEALYLQFFIYHICGNNFITQAQWQVFNNDISLKTTVAYKSFSQNLNLPPPKKTSINRK